MYTLMEKEENQLWSQIEKIYGFKNYSYKKLTPKSLVYKEISLNINISNYIFNDKCVDCISDEYLVSLEKLKKVFKKKCKEGIYILDWQHDCFYITDFDFFPVQDDDGNGLPYLLPFGETVFFVSTNLTEGWIADFNNKSIILVGESFIQAVKELKLDFLDF